MPLDMDVKIELIHLPVTDVDRAKAFYVDQCGFNADHDVRVSETLRFVQITPPGSACSFAFGEGLGGTIEPGALDVIRPSSLTPTRPWHSCRPPASMRRASTSRPGGVS